MSHLYHWLAAVLLLWSSSCGIGLHQTGDATTSSPTPPTNGTPPPGAPPGSTGVSPVLPAYYQFPRDLYIQLPNASETGTFTGNLTIKLSLSPATSYQNQASFFLLFLDGTPAASIPGGPNSVNSVTFNVDTTQYLDGPHQITAVAWPFPPPPGSDLLNHGLPVSWNQMSVNLRNNHTVMAVGSQWQVIYLKPGASIAPQPQVLYTDGKILPPANETEVSYESTDSCVENLNQAIVASFNPKKGVITAGSTQGVSAIRIEALGKTGCVTVVVSDATGISHFTKNGLVRTSYEPGQSQFVRSLFNLGPNSLDVAEDFKSCEAVCLETIKAPVCNPKAPPPCPPQPPSGLVTTVQNYCESYCKNDLSNLATAIQDAAINTLTTTFYQNPAYTKPNPEPSVQTPQTLDPAYKRQWLSQWEHQLSTSRSHDLSLLLLGDDICRTRPAMATSLGLTLGVKPGDEPLWNLGDYYWAPDYLHFVLAVVNRDRKNSIEKSIVGPLAIDMVDEANMPWGDDPKAAHTNLPTGLVLFSHNGVGPSGMQPTAIISFMNMFFPTETNGAPNDHILISWPVGGPKPSLQAARNWLGDPRFSDYASHYWNSGFDAGSIRPAYPMNYSLPQIRRQMDGAILSRWPYMQHDRPSLMLTQLSGPYFKRGSGSTSSPPSAEGDFVIGQDSLNSVGVGPLTVAAEIMYAVEKGMAGVRTYGFDELALWKATRIASLVDPSHFGLDVQTGADPFLEGTDRWRAMSAAFNLIKAIEPVLLQQPISALSLGPDFVTAARQGDANSSQRSCSFFMATYFSDIASPLTNVNLSPYFTQSKLARVNRYSLDLTQQWTVQKQTYSGDSFHPNQGITFNPGQTIVWVLDQGDPSSTSQCP